MTREAKLGGRQEKTKVSGRDSSVLVDVFAVLSVGSGEPFPPGQLQIPLKQGSISAPAQLYICQEETTNCRDLGATAAPGRWEGRGAGTGLGRM